MMVDQKKIASLAPFVSRLFWPRFIKRMLPASLLGRTLLIFVLPVAIMQLAVGWVFFDNQWRTQTARLSESLAGEIAWIRDGYEADPSAANLARIGRHAQQSLGLSVSVLRGQDLPTSAPSPWFLQFDQPLRAALSRRLNAPSWFESIPDPIRVDIRVKLKEGVLQVVAPRERAFAQRGYQFIAWLLLFTILLTAVALIFMRNQVRAIERLADAAEAFGRGGDVPQFKPHGAREVRKAAFAFIAMKERIQRHIDQRTALLASVSHDLRTPLTRLKLEIALSEPSPRMLEMKRDLSEMEHMIDEYLSFARGEGGEALEEASLRALIDDVVRGAARAGVQVKVDSGAGPIVSVRPNTLKRALSNLVMNAAAHAAEVEVAVRIRAGGGIDVTVDDNGPGIAPERYEEAFRPFSRLDEARNQNEKGVGLGLAIARDAARALGGEVILNRSPLGGLRATIRLPA